ncbi:MAG: DUF5674 family protein [Candidatus Omnitrophica bacterium]|nr:DUF5674 family protein [Candidatus Omnitrophota bacterium]
MPIEIIREKITPDKLKKLCEDSFGKTIKIVVDIDRGILAAGGELHADEEAILLEDGSRQEALWGGNFYPYKSAEERIEYLALINIRPTQGNKSMKIEDTTIRAKFRSICEKLLLGQDEQMA